MIRRFSIISPAKARTLTAKWLPEDSLEKCDSQSSWRAKYVSQALTDLQLNRLEPCPLVSSVLDCTRQASRVI